MPPISKGLTLAMQSNPHAVPTRIKLPSDSVVGSALSQEGIEECTGIELNANCHLTDNLCLTTCLRPLLHEIAGRPCTIEYRQRVKAFLLAHYRYLRRQHHPVFGYDAAGETFRNAGGLSQK